MKENMIFDSMKGLEAELMNRIRQGQRMFYFKMSKNAGYTMREIVQSAASFAIAEVSQDGTKWKSSSSLNEELVVFHSLRHTSVTYKLKLNGW